MPRLFVAIALPDGVKRDLQRLGAGLPGARWATPEQYHLTLCFIGEVDGVMFDDVAATLGEIVHPPFAVSLDGIGHFGRGRKAHTLWVSVRAEPSLIALHDRVENRLQAIGLSPERRNYTPHVTIARLKHATSARLADYLQANGAFASGPFAVDEFHLFSSFLSHNGAIYTVEASYALPQPAPQRDVAQARLHGESRRATHK